MQGRAVVATVLTFAVTVLGLLAGAAMASVGPLWLLGCTAGLLAADMARLTVALHRAGARSLAEPRW